MGLASHPVLRLAPLLAAGLCLGAAAPAPAPARADTQALPGRATHVATAGNARGDAVLAYRRSETLYVAFARRGGRFGRPRRVPGGLVGDFPEITRVAIDERGDSLIAWTSDDGSIPEGDRGIRDEGCCFRVRALIRRRSGRLTRMRTVNREGDSATLVAAAASGGRFGLLWENLEAGASVRLAAGGRSGRFGIRRSIRQFDTPIGLAVSSRRLLVHASSSDCELERCFGSIRYSGRRANRVSRRLLPRRFRFNYARAFASIARGDVLGLMTGDETTDDHILTGGGRRRLRAIRGAVSGRVALAASGRGVLVRARGGAVSVRLRRSDGRLTRPRRQRIGRRPVALAGAAVNRAGRYAVAYRSGRRSVGVLTADGPRRVRRRGGRFVDSPVHIDAAGRVRVFLVSGGRVRAWRSGG